MLSRILGFICVVLGVATADSDSILVPLMLLLIGMACLIIGGAFREPIE
jgi:hypothetical protein